MDLERFMGQYPAPFTFELASEIETMEGNGIFEFCRKKFQKVCP